MGLGENSHRDKNEVTNADLRISFWHRRDNYNPANGSLMRRENELEFIRTNLWKTANKYC